MKNRIITAAVLVAILIVAFFVPYAFPILFSLISLFCSYEVSNVVFRRPCIPLLVLSFFTPLLTFFFSSNVLLFSLFLFFFYFFLKVVEKKEVAFGTLIIAFITASFTLLITLRQAGLAFAVIPLVGAWTCDVAALFVGKYLGKRKLAPTISLNKTVEGAIGGALASILLVPVAGWLTESGMDIISLVGIGAVTGVVSQFGDIAMSAVKRSFGIKDFSNVLPGHGGFLDRFDSVLFTVPAFCFFVLI